MGNLYVKLYSKNFCGQSGTFSTRCTWCIADEHKLYTMYLCHIGVIRYSLHKAPKYICLTTRASRLLHLTGLP